MTAPLTASPTPSTTAWHRLRASHAGPLALISAVALFLFRGILSDVGFDNHELLLLYVRVQQYAVELATGHFPPRVFPDALAGGGAAFPFFSPPLAYWVSALLGLSLGDMVLGVNASFVLAVLLSGLAMYGMGVALTGRRWLAMMCALFYISLPYRLLNVLVLGALAESWTFVWYPLVLTGAWWTATRGRLSWLLPVSVAALLLTHTVLALYFCCLCALLLVACRSWLGWRGVGRVAAGALLGAAMTLWHYLPVLLSLDEVWAGLPDAVWGAPDFVHAHRVLPWQWFEQDPNRWTGISNPNQFDSMCFALGAGQWLSLVLAVGAYAMVARRGLAEGDARLSSLAKVLLALWLGCLVFMMAPLPFLLVLPRAFGYIQFPWRLQGVTLFLALAATALFLARLPILPRLGRVLAGAAVVLALATPPFEQRTDLITEWNDAILTPGLLLRGGTLGYTRLGEFLPRTHAARAWLPRVLHLPLPDAHVQVLDASREGSRWRARVDAPEGGTLVLPLVAYDFYRASRDGARALETFSEDGLLGVRLAPGSYTLTVEPGSSPPQWLGFGLGVAALGGVLFLSRGRRRVSATEPLSASGA
jgi:hypothetical protein